MYNVNRGTLLHMANASAAYDPIPRGLVKADRVQWHQRGLCRKRQVEQG